MNYTMLNVDDQEDWISRIFTEDLIDLNIMRFKRFSGRIPSDDFFLLTDLNETEVTFFIMADICS